MTLPDIYREHLPSERELSSPYDNDSDLRAIILQFVGTLDIEMPNVRSLFACATGGIVTIGTSHSPEDALIEFSRLAHRLKGSSKVLGFEALGNVFAVLEDGARGAKATLNDLAPFIATCDLFHAGLRRRYIDGSTHEGTLNESGGLR